MNAKHSQKRVMQRFSEADLGPKQKCKSNCLSRLDNQASKEFRTKKHQLNAFKSIALHLFAIFK